MRITFHGAVRNVTGSAHLVETNGSRILLETGLFRRSIRFYLADKHTIPRWQPHSVLNFRCDCALVFRVDTDADKTAFYRTGSN